MVALKRLFLASLFVCCLLPDARAQEAASMWSLYELTLTAAGDYGNPYTDVGVSATFTGPDGQTMDVPGFWDGGRTWRVRFTPTREGVWQYRTNSRDAGLKDRSGTVQVAAPLPQRHGFVRVDPEHPYHFIYDDGTRYFMLGTTYYELLAIAYVDGGWAKALRGSAQYSINKVRFNIGEGSTDARRAGFPDATPYVEGNHDRINLGHFQALDRVVSEMQSLGMVADMILFWNNDRNYGTIEQDERFVRYVLARYAAYPNVIWCLVNEWNYTKQPREYWNRLGRLVRVTDPYLETDGRLRPLSIHHQTRIDFQFFNEPWPTTAIIQLGVRNGQRIAVDEWSDAEANSVQYPHGDDWGWNGILYNRGHNKPVINDEYGYFGEPKDRSAGDVPLTREKHRRILWGIYMAGGYGSAGDKRVYDNPPGQPYFSATWHDAEEYQDLAHLMTFFTTYGLPYWQMEPLPDAVLEGKRVYVRGRPGGPFAIYAAAGGRFTVNLPAATYAVYRFDPSTGVEEPGGTVEGGHRLFVLPDAKDLVLRLIPVGGGSSK